LPHQEREDRKEKEPWEGQKATKRIGILVLRKKGPAPAVIAEKREKETTDYCEEMAKKKTLMTGKDLSLKPNEISHNLYQKEKEISTQTTNGGEGMNKVKSGNGRRLSGA